MKTEKNNKKTTTTNAPLKTMQILWSSVTVRSLVGSFFTSTRNEGCDSHEWHVNIYFLIKEIYLKYFNRSSIFGKKK